MEFILISANKVKISLSSSELEEFGLTSEIIDYGNAETKKMLWDLLCRAKHSVGFDADGYRIFVQLITSKDGSCELFVTKISPSNTSIYDMFSSDGNTDNYTEDPDIEDIEDIEEYTRSSISVFEMCSMSALSDACRRLPVERYDQASSVYIYNGKFYLIILSTSARFSALIDELSVLGEYGDSRIDIVSELYEHGTLICETKAVSIFSKL